MRQLSAQRGRGEKKEIPKKRGKRERRKQKHGAWRRREQRQQGRVLERPGLMVFWVGLQIYSIYRVPFSVYMQHIQRLLPQSPKEALTKADGCQRHPLSERQEFTRGRRGTKESEKRRRRAPARPSVHAKQTGQSLAGLQLLCRIVSSPSCEYGSLIFGGKQSTAESEAYNLSWTRLLLQ